MPAEVAVVVPAFDPGPVLVESVESVLGQTFSNIEIVVVDDGSHEDRFPALPRDDRLRVVRQENRGVSAARNKGVAATSAPLVAFLDADDRWLPSKLELQVHALAGRDDCVLCYTAHALIALDGRLLAAPLGGEPASFQSLFERNPIAMSSVVIRRTALEAAGGFDPFYSVAADWDLWLRLALVGDLLPLSEPLVEYRLAHHNAGQMSGDVWLTHLEGISILGRHELRARRLGDHELLAAIEHARRGSRLEAAERAAARFVDSIGSRRQPEWNIGRTALRIDAAHSFETMALRAARRLRHELRRSRTPGGTS